MKTRTRLVTAIGAALWLIPAVQALAGIDFTAGDWKVDISGNVNAFYVGAGCDDGPPSQTLITGGLACTGSDSAAVRTQFAATGKACKNCHDTFRVPEE